jgi:hypothetical protein
MNIMAGMKFDKDKASLTVSIIALVVSIASPFVSYRWLNQVERDDRDHRQFRTWIVDSAGIIFFAGTRGAPDTTEQTFHIYAREEGALSLDNVQFLLQLNPEATPYMSVAIHSELETDKPVVDDVRIRLKNPLALTVRDIQIKVEVTLSGSKNNPEFEKLTADLTGAWFFSDAIAGLPINILPRFSQPGEMMNAIDDA